MNTTALKNWLRSSQALFIAIALGTAAVWAGAVIFSSHMFPAHAADDFRT